VHAAYERFLADVGLPLPEVLRARLWAAPLRHAEADYLRPAQFGDVLNIELVAAHAEESEISLAWRITSKGSVEKPYAIVQTVHTFVRPDDFQRISVPSEIFQKLESVLLD
jgi:1,4-dihydroxy-2-naphthoyl-CoA hydrolase